MKYLEKMSDAELRSALDYLRDGKFVAARIPPAIEARGVRDRNGKVVPMDATAVEGELRARGIVTG